MVGDRPAFLREGQRTDELVNLHARFIERMQARTQLKIEKEYLRAQLVRTMETVEAISGVCNFGRRAKPSLDSEAFRTAYRDEALQCCSTPPPVVVQRRIFLSRSY